MKKQYKYHNNIIRNVSSQSFRFSNHEIDWNQRLIFSKISDHLETLVNSYFF